MEVQAEQNKRRSTPTLIRRTRRGAFAQQWDNQANSTTKSKPTRKNPNQYL